MIRSLKRRFHEFAPMGSNDLDEIEARIATLVEQNAAALVELQELKRQRRSLAAGYASGDKRRALVSDRNKEIRRRYLQATERYGVIVNLAKQYKLSVRQIHRIIDSDV
jgi:chromosome segregation ATPase